MSDALSALRAAIACTTSAPDLARLHAAVSLVQHIRLSEREAEARSLAGRGDDHPSIAVLRRERFWLLAVHLSLLACRLDFAASPEARAALASERDSITRHALDLLRDHPEDVAAFVPSVGAAP